MSAIDFCETCGGHGSVMIGDVPREELTPRQQQGYDHGHRYPHVGPCPDPRCDGEDHVTPILESRAEMERNRDVE